MPSRPPTGPGLASYLWMDYGEVEREAISPLVREDETRPAFAQEGWY
jgi:hypothetical protein